MQTETPNPSIEGNKNRTDFRPLDSGVRRHITACAELAAKGESCHLNSWA